MVRILTGHLMEIGYGRLSPDEFEDCLTHHRRTRHFYNAHPQGLFLSAVKYPYLEVPKKKSFDGEPSKDFTLLYSSESQS